MRMQMQWLLIIFIFGMMFSNGTVQGSNPGGMFVFGDSYVDTGNKGLRTIAWQQPNGCTFPRKPFGRASDGRVLTDFVASFFNISTPVPYHQRAYHPSSVSLGMNFAYGGTGVQVGPPNVTEQIDMFEKLIREGLYSASQLSSYVVLISVSGNDYDVHLRQKGATQADEVAGFIRWVVKQLSVDIGRLYQLGTRKFAVTGLEPLGCLPQVTFQNSYKVCNETLNKLAIYHNLLLEEAVNEIRKSRADARLAILDQFTSSMSILRHPDQYGNFKEPLKPCCTGLCARKDEKGKALYRVCANPESAFFWDVAHPTQAGWHALMRLFGSSLNGLNMFSSPRIGFYSDTRLPDPSAKRAKAFGFTGRAVEV